MAQLARCQPPPHLQSTENRQLAPTCTSSPLWCRSISKTSCANEPVRPAIQRHNGWLLPARHTHIRTHAERAGLVTHARARRRSVRRVATTGSSAARRGRAYAALPCRRVRPVPRPTDRPTDRPTEHGDRLHAPRRGRSHTRATSRPVAKPAAYISGASVCNGIVPSVQRRSGPVSASSS